MANTTVATADYGTVITAIGSAKIAACILNGTKLNITHIAVGDGGGGYYKPTTDQVDLKNECWRGEIARSEIDAANPNMINVMGVVPAEVGGFTIREAALIDEDGDKIAICNTPDAQKVAITDGVSFPIRIVMHILVTDASAVQVTVNPSLDTVSREEMENSIKDATLQIADSVGDAKIRDIIIPKDGWVTASDTTNLDGYIYTIDVVLEGVLDTHFPSLALAIPSLRVASNAKLCPTIETLDGFVRFWAKSVPTADMTGTIALRSENLVEIDSDIATDSEAQDKIEDVWGKGGSSSGGSTGDSSGSEDGPTEDDVPSGYTVATNEEVMKEVFEKNWGSL